jgi:hypothetical protein
MYVVSVTVNKNLKLSFLAHRASERIPPLPASPTETTSRFLRVHRIAKERNFSCAACNPQVAETKKLTGEDPPPKRSTSKPVFNVSNVTLATIQMSSNGAT